MGHCNTIIYRLLVCTVVPVTDSRAPACALTYQHLWPVGHPSRIVPNPRESLPMPISLSLYATTHSSIGSEAFRSFLIATTVVPSQNANPTAPGPGPGSDRKLDTQCGSFRKSEAITPLLHVGAKSPYHGDGLPPSLGCYLLGGGGLSESCPKHKHVPIS